MDLTQGDTDLIGLGWGLGLSSFLRVPKLQCSAQLRNITKEDISSLLPQITGFFYSLPSLANLLWVHYSFSKNHFKTSEPTLDSAQKPWFCLHIITVFALFAYFSLMPSRRTFGKRIMGNLVKYPYNCNLPHFSLSYITYTCQKEAMTSEWTLVSPKGSLLSFLSAHKAALNPAVLEFSFILELPGNSSLRDSGSRGRVTSTTSILNQHPE